MRVITIFHVTFRLQFFGMTKYRRSLALALAAFKSDQKRSALTINFYDVDAQEVYKKKMTECQQNCQYTRLVTRGFLKSKILLLSFDAKKRVVNCFSRTAHYSPTMVLFIIFTIFCHLQRYINVIFLHSAGVVTRSGAYLFLAPSGGGKSTVAQAAAQQGLEVLSDELHLITRSQRSFYIYRFPWGYGNLDQQSFVKYNQSTKVTRVFFLEKSNYFEIKKLPLLESLARGFPEVVTFFINTFSLEERRSYHVYVMDFLTRLFRRIRPAELAFHKSQPVFDLLEEKGYS